MKVRTKEVMSNIKNAQLIDLRRHQIINGAIKVFAEKGFHNATTRDIAAAAGLTMGTLYNYVRSKEDILYITYEFMTTILGDGLKQVISETENPRDRVSAALKHNLELIYKYRHIIMFLYREAGNYGKESIHSVLAQETKYIEVFEDLLRQRFAGKKINEDRLKLAADIISYLNVILVLRNWSLSKRFKSTDEVVEGILDFVEHAIEIIDEDCDTSDCTHCKGPVKSQEERKSKCGNRKKKN